MRDPEDAPESTAPLTGDVIRCDACPVLCRIRRGQSGACDRYANEDGKLVRLDPLLVLVCVDKKAETYPMFEPAGIFAVNFLCLEQREVSQRFAKHGGDKFNGIAWRPGSLGAPILEGTIGHVECRIRHWYDAGDHTIMVGEIETADAQAGDPLLHFRHAYRRVNDI